ncbi:MAG: hypothetical protein HQL20_11525 [Candidatus Omnitrophica bacterium]|nr:hypothetical protein [Candidatus Omnitrophota bacterium]
MSRITLQRERPRIKTNYPAFVVLLGLAIVVFGISMIFQAWTAGYSGRVSAVTFALFGIDLVLVGMIFSLGAFRGILLRHRKETFSGKETWRFDNRWNPKWAKDSTGSRILGNISGLVIVVIFILPFHSMASQLDVPSDMRVAILIFIGMLDLFLLAMFGVTVYLVLRRVVFGRSQLIFYQFPYFTGQKAQFTFNGGKRMVDREGIKGILHCINEYYEWRTCGGKQVGSMIIESLWSKECVFSTNNLGCAELFIDLPNDLPGTDLIGDPGKQSAYYWELEVVASMPGIDYNEIFLVPIYKK